MTIKSFLPLVLLASACTNGPSPEQERIVQLEQENAQLRADLEQAKSNVAKLQAVLSHGDDGADNGDLAPAGPVVPQGVDPQPGGGGGGASTNIE